MRKELNRIIAKIGRRLGSFLIILFVIFLTYKRMRIYPDDHYYSYVNAVLIVYGFLELLEFGGHVLELINYVTKKKE